MKRRMDHICCAEEAHHMIHAWVFMNEDGHMKYQKEGKVEGVSSLMDVIWKNVTGGVINAWCDPLKGVHGEGYIHRYCSLLLDLMKLSYSKDTYIYVYFNAWISYVFVTLHAWHAEYGTTISYENGQLNLFLSSSN